MSFDDLPEEAKQQVIEQIAQQKMYADQQDEVQQQMIADLHSLKQFLHSLNEDQLSFMGAFLKSVRMNPEYTLYIEGLIMSRLSYEFQRCLGCGRNHDAELESVVGDGSSESYETDQSTPAGWANLVSKLDSEYVANMATYRMSLVEGKFPKVKCAKCEMVYVSLEDRMLNQPDECSGCYVKDGWG